ncbi:hypothetical protein FKM82_012812 [Ascaphus truei]
MFDWVQSLLPSPSFEISINYFELYVLNVFSYSNDSTKIIYFYIRVHWEVRISFQNHSKGTVHTHPRPSIPVWL